MTIAVITKIPKAFFTEFQTEGEGELKLPSSLYDVLKDYFKEVDAIEFKAKDNAFTLRGKDEVYEGSLLQVELPSLEAEHEEREYGFIPRLSASIKGVYGIDAEEWDIKAEEVRVSYGDALKLSISLEEGGTYTRGVKVLDRREVSGSGSVLLDGKVLRSVISLFTGPLYLVITDGPIVLTQRTADYVLSYVVAPKVEQA
jgi:hypothetical protein